MTRTIYLRSDVNLEIRKGALLLGDTVPGAFNQAIIYAQNIENAAITGLGTINVAGRNIFQKMDSAIMMSGSTGVKTLR